MICVFEDGRILYNEKYLTPEDEGKYLAVEVLPDVEKREGYYGYWIANLQTNSLEAVYIEEVPEPEPDFNYVPEPIPIPESVNYQPTEGELIIMEAQAATLINQQEIISKQTEIDMTLAELLLNQQGV